MVMSRVAYVHGFLETIDSNVNRYINARGFEWTNKRNLLIGLSETIVYSGVNRSLDIGYLNPIGSHLEIELNDRLNVNGDGNANAVWQIHIDYLLGSRIRASFNYLLDEFVIDPNIEIGKEHGKAFSIRSSILVYKHNQKIFNLFGSMVYIGTPTFRHSFGDNNFVNAGKPLGHIWGSDGKESKIGMSFLSSNKLIIKLVLGHFVIGEESIISRPYDRYYDYQKGKFPSGELSKNKIF